MALDFSADVSGVVVTERHVLGIATVLVRKGRDDALLRRLRERFGVELPQGPRRASAGDLAFVGTGPGAWLALREGGSNSFAASLREAIGDLASVSDQSDAYIVWRLSGPGVRETLCKLVPVDVHPRAFRIGDVAVTVAAHIGATLWRLEDETDRAPVFEMATFRSYSASVCQALCECAPIVLHPTPP